MCVEGDSASYIYTTQDIILLFGYQRSMVEGMRSEEVNAGLFQLNTRHSPNLTLTKGMVDIIDRIIREKDIKRVYQVGSKCGGC